MSIFEAVKQNLTTRQAAEMYGIQVSRHGMAVCPFHNDKNPSMKVDKRFHCFACQADGDAVDFVSRLFGLPSREAAMKLADDFGISYDNRQKHKVKPHIREPTPEQRYQQEENRCYKVLSDYFHHLRTWKQQYAPKQPEDEWHPLFVEALQRESHIEWKIREINEIMNNSIEGWTPFSNPRIFAKYGRQRGWERADSGNELSATGSDLPDGFRELTEEEAQQIEIPF